jgi:heme/copper-type cytochrome/quinol oxidase subunit 3
LRWGYPTWPPPGVSKPEALLPSVVTLGLLLSVWLTYRGARALKAGDNAGLIANWRLSLLLGFAFVALMAYEAFNLPYSGIYSDVFRLMTGFHMVHALAIGVFMGNIYRGVQAGSFHADNFWPVEGAARLWYFVVVAWMLFYTVLYLL